MKIFAAQYTDCIYESGMMTLSLHKTIEGAQRAILNSQEISRQQHEEMIAWGVSVGCQYHGQKWNYENGDGNEKWGIRQMEVFE